MSAPALSTATVAALLQRAAERGVESDLQLRGSCAEAAPPPPPSEGSAAAQGLEAGVERSQQTLSTTSMTLDAEFSSKASLVFGPSITPLRSHVNDVLSAVEVWPAHAIEASENRLATSNSHHPQSKQQHLQHPKPVLLQRLEEYVAQQVRRMGKAAAKLGEPPALSSSSSMTSTPMPSSSLSSAAALDVIDLVLTSDEFSEPRLDVFRSVFEELSLQFQTYRRLLCAIHKEFELAIRFYKHAAGRRRRRRGGDLNDDYGDDDDDDDEHYAFSSKLVERLRTELKRQVERVDLQSARMAELDDNCRRQAAAVKEKNAAITTLTSEVQALQEDLRIATQDLEASEERCRELVGADEVRTSLEQRLDDAINQRNMAYERERQLAKVIKSMVPMEKLEAAYEEISRLRAESTISLLSRRLESKSFSSLVSFAESVMSDNSTGVQGSRKLIMNLVKDSLPSLQKIVDYADLDGLLAGKVDYVVLSRIVEGGDWAALGRMLEAEKVARVQQALAEDVDSEQIIHLLMGNTKQHMAQEKATRDSMLRSVGDTSGLDKNEILELRSLLQSMKAKTILRVLRGKVQRTIIGSDELQASFAQGPTFLAMDMPEGDLLEPEAMLIVDLVKSKYAKLELDNQELQNKVAELSPPPPEEDGEGGAVEVEDEAYKASKEKFWKSPGVGASVPKYLRFNGKVRNRNLSKAVCEALVKEVWREKCKKDRDTPMDQYFYLFLQKKFGIQSMVAEWGHNMIDALNRYSYDNDCEMFLKILQGELGEEVYHQQMKMLDDLQAHLQQADLCNGGKISGKLSKREFLESLQEFFTDSGIEKESEEWKEIKKALEADQPGSWVLYEDLFKEDREGNQGEFAETIRDQFVQEREDFLQRLDELLTAADTEGLEQVTVTQARRVLESMDPEFEEEQIVGYITRGFGVTPANMPPEEQQITIQVFMKNIKLGVVKKGSKKQKGRGNA